LQRALRSEPRAATFATRTSCPHAAHARHLIRGTSDPRSWHGRNIRQRAAACAGYGRASCRLPLAQRGIYDWAHEAGLPRRPSGVQRACGWIDCLECMCDGHQQSVPLRLSCFPPRPPTPRGCQLPAQPVARAALLPLSAQPPATPRASSAPRGSDGHSSAAVLVYLARRPTPHSAAPAPARQQPTLQRRRRGGFGAQARARARAGARTCT